MQRKWNPARDVRGAHVYLEISPDVRVIRRGDWTRYGYEVAAWDQMAEQWVPVRVNTPIHTGERAIAAAKAYARGLGQETTGVR